MCNNLSLEKLYLGHENCSTLTSAVVDMIMLSPTAQSLSEAYIMNLPAIAPVDVLRLARGCPRLTNLYWDLYPRLPTVAHGRHVADLVELLESRCREVKSSERDFAPDFEIHVLPESQCYRPPRPDIW